MANQKLTAGAAFPDITVPKLGGGTIDLGRPGNGHNWKMVVVYRGKHCPLCAKQLASLNDHIDDFNAAGVDVVAVSADTQDKATSQMAEMNPNYTVGYDLSVAQMQTLGLYVSDPMSAQETDRPFAEPGLFIINADGKTQFVDIANAPFLRTDFGSVLMGINFVRNPENNYPIRGTHALASATV